MIDNPIPQAEFFLCLSRAFLPPIDESAWQGMAEYLVPDLRDITSAMGRDISADLDALEGAIRGVADHQALLVGYSSLFHAPPVRVSPNAGIYLDGAVMGANTMGMQEVYARNGVERSDGFKDTPDHISIQLEFLAILLAQAAEEEDREARARLFKEARDFMRHFMAPWLPRFSRDTARYVEGNAERMPYARLAGLVLAGVAAALDDLLEALPLTEEEQEVEGVAEEIVAKRELPSVTDPATIEMIRKKLEKAGLDTTHLDGDPLQRDYNMGMKPKRPISVRKN